MAKAKYGWKDSNMELFGTDVEKKVKQAAAGTEPEWQKVKACNTPRLFIWRIEKYKVVAWPDADYGKFYNGDSYIVLRIWQEKNNPALNYDAHFWIGKYSTQDEYATAAYKTVELDMFLSDAAIQHREVEGHESEMFKSYFPAFTVMKGGCDSGFKNVKPEEYPARLFHFCGVGKNIEVREVKPVKQSLNKDDVFILDLGLEIYQWNGDTANKDEKFKAMQYCNDLKRERSGRPKVEIYEATAISKDHRFYKNLAEGAEKKRKEKAQLGVTLLFRLSDEDGSLKFEKVFEGKYLPENALGEDDVYIIDSGKSCIVYIGTNASAEEKKNSIPHAHKYLMGTDHPFIPIMGMKGNQSNEEFNSLKAH